jgi:hypothetical protein
MRSWRPRTVSQKEACFYGASAKDNFMIMYNTLVGLAAGVALILVAAFFKQLSGGLEVRPEGFALSFGVTGFILTVLGTTISVMWPYTKVLHANIMMGEPAMAFGVTLVAASFFLGRRSEIVLALGASSEKSEPAMDYIRAVLRPVSVWIFAMGLMMAALAIAILYYKLGTAPPQEPISGRFSQSILEPIVLSFLWGLTAAGALLFPAGVRGWNRGILKICALCWQIAGVLFLLFSAMNFFTHIGLLMNTSDSF